jgi:hypothetical protein
MIDTIHNPPNERTLDELYAFLSVDDNGMRGLVAHFLPGIGATTFVTGSPVVLEVMKTLVPEIARATGKRIVLYKFGRGEEVESWG